MSDFVMDLALVVLTPWVGFCSSDTASPAGTPELPPLALGSAQFANFPGKRGCFQPLRELFVSWFPC